MNSTQMKIANFKQQISVIEQEIKRLEVQDNQNRFQELKNILKNSDSFQILDIGIFNDALDATLSSSKLEEIKHLLPIYLEMEGYVLHFQEGIDSSSFESAIQFNNLIECAKILDIQIDWNSGIELIENKILHLYEEREEYSSFSIDDEQNAHHDYENILHLLRVENNKQIMSDWAQRQIEKDK